MKKKIKSIEANLIIGLVALIWWIPLIWMVFAAFKGNNVQIAHIKDWFLPPFTTDNFQFVFEFKQAHMSRWLGNSFVVAGSGMLMGILISSLAAFSLAKIKFPFKNVLFLLIISSLMIPRETLLVPLYILFKDLGLLNSTLSLILPVLAAPVSLVILKTFFESLPDELFEAARIDGADWIRIWWKIAMPLAKPAISAVAIFLFLSFWNDFLWPFISITDPQRMTMPVGLQLFKSQNNVMMGYPMAANCIAALPVLLVYFCLQKFIIKGIAFTGSKS